MKNWVTLALGDDCDTFVGEVCNDPWVIEKFKKLTGATQVTRSGKPLQIAGKPISIKMKRLWGIFVCTKRNRVTIGPKVPHFEQLPHFLLTQRVKIDKVSLRLKSRRGPRLS